MSTTHQTRLFLLLFAFFLTNTAHPQEPLPTRDEPDESAWQPPAPSEPFRPDPLPPPAPAPQDSLDPELIITSQGDNTIEGGIFTARDQVELLYGRLSLYADEMSYDMNTGWARALGNVRLFRGDGTLLTGPAMSYNTRTGEILTGLVRGVLWPFIFQTQSTTSKPLDPADSSPDNPAPPPADGSSPLPAAALLEHTLTQALATTENISRPGFRIAARSVHHSPALNRTVFRNVTMYAGSVPIMWWPKLTYQPGRSEFALQATPGYNSEWGAFLLLAYGLEVRPGLYTKPRLDYRTARGIAGGLDTRWFHGPITNPDEYAGQGERGQGLLNIYLADDLNPPRVPEDGRPDSRLRYRITARERYHLTPSRDLTLSLTADLLSDATIVRDFFPDQYVRERQPDNHVELLKRWPDAQASLLVRPQINPFFETVERLPEVRLDIPRQQLHPGIPLYYASQSSAGRLQRRFATSDRVPSPYRDYNATRLDTYQELSTPFRFARVFNFVASAGWRGTWYDDSLPEYRTRIPGDPRLRFRDNTIVLDEDTDIEYRRVKNTGGAPVARSLFTLNVEGSTKLSRTYNWIKPEWGIDRLRHVVQPWFHFSYIPQPVKTSRSRLMQFDERFGSTRLAPLSFPQYNSIDDISRRLTLRLGLDHRFQTLRDGRSHTLLSLSTYLDVDPFRETYDYPTSNLFNELTFHPVPWLTLAFYGSSDLHTGGFHEYNTSLQWQIARPLALRLSHRFLDNSRDFRDSNQLSLQWLWRIDDNWFFSTRHVLELADANTKTPGPRRSTDLTDLLRTHEYTLSRDLSSWRASLTARWDNNRTRADEFSIYLSLTLKAFPQINIPLNYSAAGQDGTFGF